MPSQPKIDPAKLRSQISRRVDNSFPVFARLVWHAGHADREASWVWHARHAGHEIGMPSVTDFDVRSALYHDIHRKQERMLILSCRKHITHASAFT